MMLVETLQSLYEYNRWATGRILDHAAALTPEQLVERDDMPHGSVRDALVHILDVQWGWLSWCDGSASAEEAYERSIDPEEYRDVGSIREKWEEVERQTGAFLSSLTDQDLSRVLTSSTPAGDSFSIPTVHVLHHLITHAMQHRSEIAVRLTRFGHSPGDLDYIFFVWPKH
jgi:uncharacterized damage-inducible protein DinB